MTSMFKAPSVAAPKEPDPVRIPSADDPDLMAARRKKMLDEASGKQGRASTVLAGDKAGAAGSAPAYSRTTLG